MGVKALRKIQFGKESGGSAGTAVAATTIWRGTGLLEDTKEVKIVEEQIGVATNTTRAYIPKLGCKVTFDPVEATFQQIPYLFEAGVAIETPTQDGTGSGYIYEYIMATTTIPTIETYTIEMGDDVLVQETDYAFVEAFKITGNAAEGVMMSADWVGRDVVDTTFTGALSAPTLIPADHIVFGGSNLYVDAVGGTLGNTEITSTLLSFELDVKTGRKAKWTNLAKEFDYAYFDAGSFEATLKLVYENDSNGTGQRDLFEAGTPRQLRLNFTGAAVADNTGATYNNLTFHIDCAGVYTAMPMGDKDGNNTIEAEMKIGYDLTATLGLTFRVVNELSSLP